jgi:hypothetical protein
MVLLTLSRGQAEGQGKSGGEQPNFFYGDMTVVVFTIFLRNLFLSVSPSRREVTGSRHF